MRKRLAYFSYDSLGNPWLSGGGALRDLETLKRQAAHWDVDLWVGRYPGFTPAADPIRMRGLGWGRSNWLCRFTYALAANARVLMSGADAIGNSLSIYAPVLTGLLRPGRCYYVAHHYVGGESLKKFGWPGVIPFLLEKILFRFGRNFIVSNRALAGRIRGINSRARVLVTSNSVDPALFDAEPVESSPGFILFLGRFDAHMKGLDLLLEAYRDLDAGTRPRLVLAGAASPEALEAVRRLVPPECADAVELKPNVSESEKRALLSACLFFCSPSRFEGFGIAALEANAAGKAALVTDTDGFRDSVQKDYSALVVAVGDVAALRTGMRALLEDPGLRRRLGANGRLRARRFSWDSVAAAERDWIAAGFPAIAETAIYGTPG